MRGLFVHPTRRSERTGERAPSSGSISLGFSREVTSTQLWWADSARRPMSRP